VRLLVEEALLEGPDVAPALVGIDGATLEHVEVVEDRIGVAAVVGVAHVSGLELVEVEVGIDHVAALEVGAEVEVAGAEVAEVRAGLLDLLAHRQADLAPLVDEPGADVLVGHRDVAVLEHEREPAVEPGGGQQAPRLGP
jgi:hypothetical protein